jgi:hypothetical protein
VPGFQTSALNGLITLASSEASELQNRVLSTPGLLLVYHSFSHL